MRGAGLTGLIASASFTLGILIGLVGAYCRRTRFAPVRAIVILYTTTARGVPELLIIYLLFFGGAAAVTQLAELLGISDITAVDAFLVGVLSLGIISGSYSVEVFRGAIQALSPGQLQAARAFGLGKWITFRRIALPQLLRLALPGLGNVWQVTIKDTALVSVTGLAELMRVTYIAAGSSHYQFLIYLVTIGFFLAITALSGAAFDLAERRLNRGYKRSSHSS